MRFVVYGAGAIGGVVGWPAGRRPGTRWCSSRVATTTTRSATTACASSTPDDEPLTLSIPVVSHPAGIDFRDDDVVLLAMKSQHTGKALSALAATAPADDRGGVRAERRRQRAGRAAAVRGRVRRVRGAAPRCTSSPAWSRRTRRRSPASSTSAGSRTASDRAAENDRGRVRVGDVRVGGARPTSCGGSTGSSSTTSATRSTRCAVPIPRRASCTGGRWDEGAGCLAAAGIDAVAREEDAARRGDVFQWGGDAARSRPGRVVVAEPGPGHRLDRGRLPQRRDRAARAGSTACPPR